VYNLLKTAAVQVEDKAMTLPAKALRPVPLLILAALFSSSCLWGVVRDARTGAPVAGASVSFHDAAGSAATTVTNSDGLFAFDASQVPVAAPGAVGFTVTATGYQTLDIQRDVLYDDNAEGTWDVQTFELTVANISSPNPPSGG
jgi:hypothetical protein